MNIKFYDRPGIAKQAAFSSWFDKNEKRLNELGFVKNDKTLYIGDIQVAKLITTTPPQILLDQIGKFSKVNRVYVS